MIRGCRLRLAWLFTLRGLVAQIPPRLITKTARRIGAERAAELRSFLDSLQAESFGGRAM